MSERNPMHLTDDEFLNDREVPEAMCEKCNELKQLLGVAIIRLQQLGDKEFIFPATPGDQGLMPVAMGSLLQRIMARLADLLDADQFNEINGMVEDSGYTAPARPRN